MVKPTAFDRQLADVLWLVAAGLRSGYSVPQVIEHLASVTVEPTASTFDRLLQELQAGCTYDTACAHLQEAQPSPYLARVVAAVQQQRQMGGNLADRLDSLGADILREIGTDGALYPEMRTAARELGALLPERAQSQPGADDLDQV